MNRYIIVDAELVDYGFINQSLNNGLESIRYNDVKTKAVLKVPDPIPDELLDYKSYTHAEILIVLGDAEWQDNPLD